MKKILFVLAFALVMIAVIGRVSAPPPPTPVVTSVSPSSGTQGQAISGMYVYGSDFQETPTVSFSGTGITVTSVTFIDTGTLQIDITISISAPTGLRDVTVTNPNARSGTGTGLFTVFAGGSVPEFPLGAVLPIALVPILLYVWLKRKNITS